MSHSKMNDEVSFGKNLRVALVHDWLVSYRGGEKVLQSIGKLFPSAPIYTLFYHAPELPEWFHQRDVRAPILLNKLHSVRKILLPFLPSAIEAIDLKGYDLIISTSSCVAKGIIPPLGAKHVCYIHSPMRYIWDQRHEYFRNIQSIPVVSSVLDLLLSQLRIWDVCSANRVDSFVANSQFVKQRVHRYYRRDSSVINPPVFLDRFLKKNPTRKDQSDFFLTAGAFVPYKRFDLAIEACEKLGHKLVVAGGGPSERYLRSLAGDKTEFVISPSQEKLAELMAKAKGFIFPAVEDFGIVSIEAMASGTPVIALKEGGSLDYLKPGENGLFFETQTVDSLISALQSFKLDAFDLNRVVESTRRFSEERFLDEFRREVQRSLGA